jgi:tRNA 5-methylaminomethyl-2-thiouridine biosynthesis bifunctional protein
MPRLPPLPNIIFDDKDLIKGIDFNDSYFSRDDGLAETKAVFLAGNDLPKAWHDTTCFVIGELGFGTGLNVLATWDLWNQTRPNNGILHIITVEGFLMEAHDAARAHAHWPKLGALSAKLRARWPTRAYGTQRVWFREDRLCLTFLIGPCDAVLASAEFKADCWFLDGFAPARNPDMWRADTFANIARLSNRGSTLATYSVSGAVRSGLTDAGFAVERKPGFGSKRQRLEGVYTGGTPKVESPTPRSAIVIGGGIGGAAMCDALARRGIAIDLIDPDPCGTTKASGNPLALVIPRLDKGDTREAAFYRAAFLAASDAYQHMGPDCFTQTGAIERGEDEAAQARLVDLLSDPPFPPSHMSREVGKHAIIHHRAGTAFPDRVLTHLKGAATRHPVPVSRIDKMDGFWRAFDGDDNVIAQADICIVAAGTGLGALCDFDMDLGARAGQLSWAKLDAPLPDIPVSGAGYGARFGDRLVFGASYERLETGSQISPPVTAQNHLHNQYVLGKIAPELAPHIDLPSAAGRTSIRVTTSDQMPIAGPAPQTDVGLYILGGLGSRGFSTAFLCAEIIASQAFGEPLPVSLEVKAAIAPDRFLKRRAKRRPSTGILK